MNCGVLVNVKFSLASAFAGTAFTVT